MKFILCAMVSAVLLLTSCKKDSPLPASTPAVPAKIFVANENGQSIQVVDANNTDNNVAINIDDHTGDMLMAHNVQVAPDGKSVWATIHPMLPGALDQVIVIDPNDLSIKKRIYVGLTYHLAHVVLDQTSQNAFVTATDSHRIVMIDAINYSVKKTFMLPDGYEPHGMRYSNGKLYVACMGAKCLSIIDVASAQRTDIALNGIAIQTAVTPNGKYVFASLYDTKEVARYDVQTGQVVKLELPNGSQGPVQVYPTPDNKSLVVCDQGKLNGMPASNKVYLVDIASLNVTATIIVGNAVHGVVVSKDGKKAYVTNSDDDTVSVIDLVSGTVEKTIPVGLEPDGISYWYEGGGMP